MASQGLSRKRAAPGTSPVEYAPQMQPAANPYTGGLGPQLSDDQFLMWGQSAQAPNTYPDASTYSQQTNMYPPSGIPSSTQLTRRPISQVPGRLRPQDETNGFQWVDPTNSAVQPSDAPWVDDTAELELKAQKAKKDALGKRKQIPPFIQKLSSFLDDGKNTDLIRWSDDGRSFIVLDEDEFAKTLIPELFKHNNYASFVRQLNMYGFHKKVGLSDNSMRASERKNKSPSEYYNQFFRRGLPDLLWLIQKPKNTAASNAKGKRSKADSDQNEDDGDEYVEEIPNSQDVRPRHRMQLAIEPGEQALTQDQMQSIQRELGAIRHQQAQINRMMASLKREHEQLYGQAASFQDQHTRHENSINAILTFLATVYNRSLQGHDGAQGITNLFAGSIPHEGSQGNVVDVGDFNFDGLGSSEGTPNRPFKKAPLLLQAAPANDQTGRVSSMSPASTTNSYQGRQTRRMSHVLRTRSNNTNVEEFLDSNAPTPASTDQPPRDIMSVIQSTNARHSNPDTPVQDFSNVLSSLENSGGNTPLSSSQRADMLRLINDTSNPNQTGDNALINVTPPPMPASYGRRLASTSADLDSLAKMQAEQDRSVQNLTQILQPLSPTGSIPGLGDGQSLPVPSNLNIDDFLNSQEYFGDFPSDGLGNYDFGGNNGTNGSGMNFDLNNSDNDDVELFGDLPSNDQNQESGGNGYGGFGVDGATDEQDGGGRVESVDSSEATTPVNTTDFEVDAPVTRAKGRQMSINESDNAAPKRRRKNER